MPNSPLARIPVGPLVRVAGAIALVTAVMSAGCKRGAPQAAGPGGMPPTLVTTAEVLQRDVPVYLDEIGKCAAVQTVSIKPQVSGTIEKIHFTDGSDVKKGQVLFEIDPRPYIAALAQAKAQLAQSTAQLGFANVDYNRIKDLPRSVEPQSDVDAKQNAIDVAKAQSEAARAAIEAAEINVKYCTIVSPLDGLAGQRLVDSGNVVIANNPMGAQANLLTIQQMDPIYSDFTITENDLSKVRANMALGTLQTTARLPSDADSREGQLSFLDNSIQDGAGIIKLRATLPNKDRHFWPGAIRVRTARAAGPEGRAARPIQRGAGRAAGQLCLCRQGRLEGGIAGRQAGTGPGGSDRDRGRGPRR